MPKSTKEQIDKAKEFLSLYSTEQERDALKARCAELEARLQGAADRAIKWQTKLCEADHWSCKNCTECTDLRAAILGEKEDQVGKI